MSSDVDEQAADEHVDDGETIVVRDPDDYNQARRLKTIHQARDDVRKARKEAVSGRAKTTEHQETKAELAQAVATYGHELLPLMDAVGWEHEFDDGHPVDSVRRFVRAMGNKHIVNVDGAEWVPVWVSMEIYGKLNKFMAEYGLGVDLDDDTDEWEV